ncbi:U8 snoRNA-decapping enzyme [Pholidichthys leucotaenia]
MASGQLSRAEALADSDCRHACHVMFYGDTEAQLFGRIPIRHIVLMQMRFDGLLGFPGGLVNPSEETLEAGLSRELLEEVGMSVEISEENHVDSCYFPAPPSARLITHFYAKKMEEEQLRMLERAAASAEDHGHEVLGMVRVPLYNTKSGCGLANFLSNSFIGNARSQLVDALLRFNLVTADELHRALSNGLKTHGRNTRGLRSAVALTDKLRKQV